MQLEKINNHTALCLLERGIKRAFDVILSGAGLVVFSPTVLAVSIAIKLDSRGPIFVRVTRYDYENQIVQVLKFRSRKADDTGSHVTRAGHILGRTGINELLQLFNVLRGEMSIVGPHLNATRQNILQDKIRRLSRRQVKPGIIGWAQVHGYGGETGSTEYIKQRIEYDLYYIENWSLLLDVKIIFATIVAKGSYV